MGNRIDGSVAVIRLGTFTAAISGLATYVDYCDEDNEAEHPTHNRTGNPAIRALVRVSIGRVKAAIVSPGQTVLKQY